MDRRRVASRLNGVHAMAVPSQLNRGNETRPPTEAGGPLRNDRCKTHCNIDRRLGHDAVLGLFVGRDRDDLCGPARPLMQGPCRAPEGREPLAKRITPGRGVAVPGAL